MDAGREILIIALAMATSSLGAIGGLGGAIILVPLLTLGGMSVSSATPR